MKRNTRRLGSVLACLLIVLANVVLPAGGVSAAGSTYYVGTLADDAGTNTANCAVTTNTDCTLRDAIAAATSGSDTILFKSGLSGTITLTNGTLSLATSVTITGPGANIVTISGNNAVQIFNVGWDYIGGAAPYPNFSLGGLTVANGSGVDGGAMHIDTVGTVSIAYMTFANNTASDSGGAIFNAYYGSTVNDVLHPDSSVTISNSTFSGNVSSNAGRMNNVGTGPGGGAIYNFGYHQNVTIINSTFSGNQAPGFYADGGAIKSSPGGAGDILSVVNCTITENSANGGTGGISNTTGAAPATLTNTIVTGNHNYGSDSSPDLGGDFSGNNNQVGNGNSAVTGSNNLIGVAPLLGSLGNYVGPTQTVPLLPSSPAIGAGATGTNIPTSDQRGVPRLGHVDVGAFQSRGFTVAKVSGDNQSAPAYAAFAQPLVVAVSSPYAEPVQGGTVTFTGPTSGAGIQGGPYTAAIATNGQASQAVTATSPGSYSVSAGPIGAAAVIFSLTNEDTDLALTNMPANITINNSATPTVVSYTLPTVVDEDPDATVSCTPPPGSTFPVGVTTVTCTATDSDDLNSPVNATFTVTVGNFDLILTNVPDGITVPATSAAGAVVTYALPTAVDEDGSVPSVSCTPPSGSTFPHGTTTVTCTATDSDDTNSPVTASFNVIVTTTAAITTCDESTLRSAIANAKMGDTLTFGCSGTITLTSPITLSTNFTLDGSGQHVVISGGGTTQIFANKATVTLNDLTIADGKGGITNQGNLTVANCTFSGNSGTSGGAINNSGTLTVTGCTFSGNSATDGGAIYDFLGTLTVTNSTFSDNTATHGGAIYEYQFFPTITHSTFSGNSATAGGAIFLGSSSTFVYLKNSILANSPTGDNCNIGSGGLIVDQGGNLADDSSCLIVPVTTGSLMLGPLADNGGPTQTIALGSGSAAIDFATCDASITTDQRGLARPDNGETTCDSGAYEVQDTAVAQATSVGAVSGTGPFGGTATLTATLTAGGAGVANETVAFTLNGNSVGTASTDSSGVATLTNVSLVGINAGSYANAIGAGFAGNSSLTSSSGTGPLTVAPATQSISFTSTAPSSAVYGDTYTPTATGGASGNPVTFGASGACAYDSGTGLVTMTGTGTCTVTADQAGNTNFSAASQVQQSFSVGQAPATIALDAATLNPTYDGAPHTVTATTTPGGLSYSVTYNGSSTPPTNAGSYAVVATITDPNHSGSVSGTLVIAQATPVLTWSNPADITYGTALDATQLDATADVPGTFSYTPPSGTLLNAGAGQTLSVLFTPADTTNYTTATASVSINVAQASQSISFDLSTLPAKTYGDGSFDISGFASASSRLPVSFNSATPAVCAVSGSTVTVMAAGTCTISADQAGNTNFTAAPQIRQSFSVARAGLMVTANDQSMVYGGLVPTFDATVTGLVNGDTFDGVGGTCSTAVNGNPVASDTPAGTYPGTITCSSVDSANYDVTYVAGTLTVKPATIVVTPDDVSVQYSDPLPALTAKYSGFVLGQDQSVLGGTLACTTTADISGAGQVLSPAGTYGIICSGLSAANYQFDYRSGTLTVTAEDTVVRLAQNNPHAVQVDTSGKTKGAAPAMTFTARITEVADDFYGDIALAAPVTLVLNPIGTGGSIISACSVNKVQPATTTSPGFELVGCDVPAGTPINVYEVTLTVGGAFYQGSDASVLTVFDPTAGGSNGAGTITNPSTGFAADVSYSADYLKNGNVQGKFLYIARDADGNVVHILKGNAMSTMAISGATAKITGKATLDGVGNYSYVITGIDNGTSTDPNPASTPDQYGQQVTDPSGTLVTGLSFGPVDVGNGNIFAGK